MGVGATAAAGAVPLWPIGACIGALRLPDRSGRAPKTQPGSSEPIGGGRDPAEYRHAGGGGAT